MLHLEKVLEIAPDNYNAKVTLGKIYFLKVFIFSINPKAQVFSKCINRHFVQTGMQKESEKWYQGKPMCVSVCVCVCVCVGSGSGFGFGYGEMSCGVAVWRW